MAVFIYLLIYTAILSSFVSSLNLRSLKTLDADTLRTYKCSKDIQPSHLIADYSMLAKIGSGTFGDVFLVNYTSCNCIFALKCYKKRSDDYSREIYFGRILSDVFIQALQSVEISGKYPEYRHAIVFEWIPYTITDFLNLPSVQDVIPDLMPSIILSLCQGLVEIHEMGICHLDIKPGNILIDADFTPSGELCYCKPIFIDLGMMSYLSPPEELNSYAIPSRSLTRLGTKVYRPIELYLPLTKDRLTTTLDIWSFGLTFFALCSNSRSIFHPLVKSNQTDLIPLFMFRMFSPSSLPQNVCDPFGFKGRIPSDHSWPSIASEKWHKELVQNYTQLFLADNPSYNVTFGLSIIKDIRSLALSVQNRFGKEVFLILKGFLRIHPASRMTAKEAVFRLKQLENGRLFDQNAISDAEMNESSS
ncbi:hypothetical protein DI09_47p70 [Mitosporidium daphniae]|uniref:Protein kinase domain-containing protein n=1 Tax=Mitosporidium daphniae TaxID=1485682 RepID=A0A098VQE4_9MICR|nr:uncharacterized protein DI09_47p70 [Mitosporidium daphniae]KGG51029.1 hypothetical protein DI09_47p70 [Mitosporidium daphniae]|eukprot:XP_013237480.1 uncharacterized protein DI09_47p70 [Mitosporidium daphniae]